MKHWLIYFLLCVSLLGCVKENLLPQPSRKSNPVVLVIGDTVVCNYSMGFGETLLINRLNESSDSAIWRVYESNMLLHSIFYNQDTLNYSNLNVDSGRITLTNFMSGDSSFAIIEVNDCFQTMYIPNSSSPNGDGINDTWHPVFHNVNELNWIIRSEQGEEIIDNEGNLNTSWDGSWNDNPAPSGLYQYHIQYLTIDTDEIIEHNGWLQLLRN